MIILQTSLVKLIWSVLQLFGQERLHPKKKYTVLNQDFLTELMLSSTAFVDMCN